MSVIFLRNLDAEETTEVTDNNPLPIKSVPNVVSAIRYSQVTVNTVAIKLPASPLGGRTTIAIANNGTAAIFIGGSDVTTSNGFPVANTGTITLNVGDNVPVYGISTAGQDVRILEKG